MVTIDIKTNLQKIINSLEIQQGMKRTNIAKQIGYTTTAQLNSTLDGDSLISTKAVIGLIENLNVNPYFLFMGEGEMFIVEGETELDKLAKEKSEWERKFFGLQDEHFKCMQELEVAVRRYNNLIDITSKALENTKREAGNENDSETN